MDMPDWIEFKEYYGKKCYLILNGFGFRRDGDGYKRISSLEMDATPVNESNQLLNLENCIIHTPPFRGHCKKCSINKNYLVGIFELEEEKK